MARIEDKVVYSSHPGIEIPVCSFYSLLKDKLQVHPDKLALVDEVTHLKRGELLARIQRYALGFGRHGVQPGDRVCVHLSNTVENMVAMCGCIVAGATAVMSKTSLTENELRYYIEDSDSVHILTDVLLTEKVTKAAAGLTLKGRFSMGSAEGFVSATEFNALDETEFEESPILNPKDAVMALLYTSGTTGLPKGAEVTHYNFVASFYITCGCMPWTDQDISLGTNPITHISGLVFILMPVINGSSCVVVSATAAPREIIDAIDKYNATVVVMFPTPLHVLVAQIRLEGRRLPSMRHVIVGGNVVHGVLSDAVCSTFESIRTFRKIYGMTETCLVCTIQPEQDGIAKRGNDVGLPLVTTSIKIVDVQTGKSLGPNKMGEIRIRNASMVRGYYKRPMESAELFDNEGWMKTGDAGYYDEDGRLYFVERLKQLIKCMNNQVIPRELEELLLRTHEEDIAQVSVVGLPHNEYGEVAAAAIVPTEKGRKQDPLNLADRIKATVKEHLAMYKHLHGGVFFLDSFPTTATSKVNRAALTRLIADMS